jgi:type I restriction enzyme S subunit
MRMSKTGAMDNDNKRRLTPKLRFPEFRNAGNWEEIELGTLGELVPGLTYSPNDVQDIGLLVLRSSNIKNGEITLDDRVYVNPQIKSANLTKTNDILICVRNGSADLIGKNALIPEKMPLSTHGAFMTVFRSQSARFVFQLFQTSRYQKQVDADLGATINSINGRQLIKYKFIVPKPPEQQKIASCLSSVDELIAAETQKLNALKVHKKGLMQQLFPDAGEPLPSLRFPEFRDAPEWEEKSIGDLGEIVTGSTPSTARPEYYGGHYHFVSPADISDMRFVNDTRIKLTNSGFGQVRAIKAGSVLFVCIGSTIGKVAQNLKECATNQQINSIIPFPEYSAGFIYYILSQQSDRIAGLAGKQAVPIINKTSFSAMKLFCPKFKEQERISTSLSFVDEIIYAQSQKLRCLKTYKAGLMQQLFPMPDEEAS